MAGCNDYSRQIGGHTTEGGNVNMISSLSQTAVTIFIAY